MMIDDILVAMVRRTRIQTVVLLYLASAFASAAPLSNSTNPENTTSSDTDASYNNPSVTNNMTVNPWVASNYSYAYNNTSSTGAYVLITHIYVATTDLKKRCMLLPDDDELVYKIKAILDSGSKLIKYHLKLDEPLRELHGKSSNVMHKPLMWVRTTGRHGKGLLLLRPEYDILSLSTLEIGAVKLNVTIKEHPPGCLSNVTYMDAELLIRDLIMNDFQNSSMDVPHIRPSDNVCNQHIVNIDGTASFLYFCCQRDDIHHVSCEYLESDIWLEVLLSIITVLKVLVILFSPRFIPDSFYHKRHIALPYIHTLSPSDPLKIRTVLTKQPSRYISKNVIKISKFRTMGKFKGNLQKMKADVPVAYTIPRLHLRVKGSRLLNEKSAPVGIFETLYSSFVKCGIKDRASVVDCCKADVCLKLPYSKNLAWFRVLKEFMKFVLMIIFAMPWIVRVFVYFKYEHDEMTLRKSLAAEKKMKFYFPENWTLYLTPLHIVFIFIYIILSLESLVFGVMRKKTKEKIKLVLRKCFRDMRELSKMDVIGWSIRNLIRPCVMCGALGICFALITWVFMLPVVVVVLSFYMFPTLNITARLLAHFCVYLFPKNVCSSYRVCRRISDFLETVEKSLNMKQLAAAEKLEKNEKVLSSLWTRIQQLIIIVLCLISMYSVIFLVVEFVSFAVEIFVYTLMGLIVNANSTMTYVSLTLLLGVYGNDCFGSVRNKFLAFNQTLNGCILKLGKEKIESVTYKSEINQGNTAFTVKTDHNNEIQKPVQLITSADGLTQPRWNVSRLLLFLSKNDEPLIPRTFYFSSCKMPFYAVPGELLLNYLRATMEFGIIIIFLLFVLVVVLAFGDTYEISATNQLLATIAGGFVPFMLKNIVFQQHQVTSVDTGCISFQVCLNDAIETYEQSWPIEDIHVVQTSLIFSDLIYNDASGTRKNTQNNGDDKSAATGDVFTSGPIVKGRNIKRDVTPLDLVIDARELDEFDFPNMTSEQSPSNRDIGSTSFLDDFDDEEFDPLS